MRCISPLRRRSPRIALAILLPVLALLAGTPRAEAVSIYFTGPGGFGVAEADALATGLPIFEWTPALLNDGELKIKTPNPVTEDTKATSDGTPSDPATGTTKWKAINIGLGDPDDQDLWLVFYSVADTSFNAQNFPGISPDQVGLEIGGTNWAFLNPPDAPDVFYPALFLGDLEQCMAPGAPERTGSCPAETRTLALIQYRVLTNLPLVEGTYMYPQFWVGRANAPIPEPSSVLLFAAGVVGLATFRRHR